MHTNVPPVNNSILSVSTLNRLVRDCLESAFPLSWVGGEISNLTYAASGHVYFSLKDAGAQVRCVMWRSRAQTLGWRLENGQKVEARALVSFYEPRGEFQLNIEAIRRAGQGDLFERFLRLKAQLENEGIFAVDRKRPLPAFPRRLAIVTSPQAAALRDVLSTLHRRAPHVAISLFPTPVQGDGAGERIAAAIAEAGASDCDTVILCRGGGSIEDLWAFNEECVARAIVACPLPVISGVGHETDFTIADFAADQRAPTPTAAAELAAPEQSRLLEQLARLQDRLQRQSTRRLADRQQTLDWLRSRLVHPAERIASQRRAIDQLTGRLRRALITTTQQQRLRLAALSQRAATAAPQTADRHQTLDQLSRRLAQAAHWQTAQRQMKLNALAAGLKQLDPQAVLSRGYALVIGPDGRALRDNLAVNPGDRLKISLAHGKLDATVLPVVAPDKAD
ncbi:exodeoxyribonuclease VII large subunit [Azonexus hydrophilus]|uniref:Exodeoxyribonuclease 7 large subunit n=1 Tax=Azonexus hydrophilus TaxID=418702 RepID=A0A1R1HZW8_9RHOO|nr:exodeoxyribonuclease VII large subunit [Azonexus hydrophilus]OMG52023.1 exodeoxyribonuclease VII large subunit [Azonexus hydrophilus]